MLYKKQVTVKTVYWIEPYGSDKRKIVKFENLISNITKENPRKFIRISNFVNPTEDMIVFVRKITTLLNSQLPNITTKDIEIHLIIENNCIEVENFQYLDSIKMENIKVSYSYENLQNNLVVSITKIKSEEIVSL